MVCWEGGLVPDSKASHERSHKRGIGLERVIPDGEEEGGFHSLATRGNEELGLSRGGKKKKKSLKPSTGGGRKVGGKSWKGEETPLQPPLVQGSGWAASQNTQSIVSLV